MELFLVLFVALMIPLYMAKFKISFIPTAIAEIVVGIILGKTGVGWIHTNPDLESLAVLGVTFLMFLSGMEINFDLFRLKDLRSKEIISPLKISIAAFSGILFMSLGLSVLLTMFRLFDDIFLSTILFSTIGLGVVIATLKEKKLLESTFGQTLLLTAVLGEIVSLLALSVFEALNGGSIGKVALILVIFLAATVLLLYFKRIHVKYSEFDKETTQIDIRLAMFLIFSLALLAEKIGVENILGAFLAGIIMKLLHPSKLTEDKLTSIGYGFFIPIYFIMTGANLDLSSLFTDPKTLILIPILFLCFFIAKIPILFIFKKHFSKNNTLAGMFLCSSTITLVLAVLSVAEHLNELSDQQQGAFTLAAVFCCVAAPMLFNKFFQAEK